MQLIDLTHTLNEKIPTYSKRCPFKAETISEYPPAKVMKYTFHLSAAGTHMDAPTHFYKDGINLDQIPLENLIVPLCVIDVSNQAHDDFFLSKEHVEHFEKTHGTIPKNSFVAAYTGWERYWSDPVKYLNKDENRQWHYPGFSPESVELLLKKDIAGIGIDTLNPDGANREYPVHHAILGAGKYIVENLANLNKVAPFGAQAILLPLKIEGGCEGPIRAVAMIT